MEGRPVTARRGWARSAPHRKRDASHRPPHSAGRWPANVVLDETQAEALDSRAGTDPAQRRDRPGGRARPTARTNAAGYETTCDTSTTRAARPGSSTSPRPTPASDHGSRSGGVFAFETTHARARDHVRARLVEAGVQLTDTRRAPLGSARRSDSHSRAQPPSRTLSRSGPGNGPAPPGDGCEPLVARAIPVVPVVAVELDDEAGRRDHRVGVNLPPNTDCRRYSTPRLSSSA